MEIEWRDIPEYEGLYRVSEYGDVLSLDRAVPCGNGYRIVKKRLLKRVPNDNGYLQVKLSKDNNTTTYRCSILVAMAFIPNPNNLPIVKHLDNIKINNHYTNLMWDNQSNNTLEALRDGLVTNINENHNLAKLTNEDVLEIRNSTLGNTVLARKYNVERKAIWRIKTGQTWKHL